jgi:hypothetical protein
LYSGSATPPCVTLHASRLEHVKTIPGRHLVGDPLRAGCSTTEPVSTSTGHQSTVCTTTATSNTSTTRSAFDVQLRNWSYSIHSVQFYL